MHDFNKLDNYSPESLQEVKIDRISNAGNLIAESNGSHIHVHGRLKVDVTPRPRQTHVVEIKKDSSPKIGLVTGFRTFDEFEQFDFPGDIESWESGLKEWNARPKPEQYFQGTINHIDDSGTRILSVENEFVDAVLANEGDVGDEVVVRLTRKSGDNLIGRVIDYPNKEPNKPEISEDEKKQVKHKFDNVDYNSNMNRLLNTDS